MRYIVKKISGKDEWFIYDTQKRKPYGSSSTIQDEVEEFCKWLNDDEED